MKALLLALALGAGSVAIGPLIAPNAGSSQQLLRLDVYNTQDGGYSTLNARGWFLADGGLDVLPTLPSNLVVTSWVQTGVCASVTLCVGYDGGADPTQATTSACACSTGPSCRWAKTGGFDGGAAAMGVTLAPGAFDGGGSGCLKKVCTELFVWGTSSWPAECPGGS